MFSGLDHLDIAVERLGETVEFLKKLGFEVIRESEERGSVELRFPGGPEQPFIELRSCQDRNGNVKPAGLRHIALTAPAFDETYTALKAQGLSFKGEPRFVEASGRRVVNAIDPNGTPLQIVSAEEK